MEHIDIINALSEQIIAILDLVRCQDIDCADVRSIQTAIEMALNMHEELMQEVNLIEEDYLAQKVQQHKLED